MPKEYKRRGQPQGPPPSASRTSGSGFYNISISYSNVQRLIQNVSSRRNPTARFASSSPRGKIRVSCLPPRHDLGGEERRGEDPSAPSYFRSSFRYVTLRFARLFDPSPKDCPDNWTYFKNPRKFLT